MEGYDILTNSLKKKQEFTKLLIETQFISIPLSAGVATSDPELSLKNLAR